jgi:hypothetical protein
MGMGGACFSTSVFFEGGFSVVLYSSGSGTGTVAMAWVDSVIGV